MATQPLYQPYTPPPAAPSRTSISVAFSGGVATAAVERRLAEMPAATREATLDEMVIADATSRTITLARALLSPDMFAAFITWGAAAAQMNSVGDHDGDDGGQTHEAIRAAAGIDARNEHDIMFKAWLLNVEATDGPVFGTVVADPEDTTTLHLIAVALNADLIRRSPLVASLEALSHQARERSALRWGFSQEIGAAMVAAFVAAEVDKAAAASESTVRTSWTKALERYQLAQATSDVTECGSPVADQMVERSCDAMDDLIARTRAPDVQAIALKVALAVNRANAFECIIFDEHLYGIIADVQRLSAMDIDPHPELLADHARSIDAIESIPLAEWSDDRADREMAKVYPIEDRILSTRAATPGGVIAKLALIAQEAQCHRFPKAWVADVLEEAVREGGIVVRPAVITGLRQADAA